MYDKEELERQKLALEIKELNRPYYLRHQFIAIFGPIMVALIGLLGIMLSNYYNDEKVNLEENIKALKAKQKILLSHTKAFKQLITTYQTSLTDFDGIIKNEFDDLHRKIDAAENKALKLKLESEKFPSDTTLRCEATKAAAEYSLMLCKTQGIYIDSLKKFNDGTLKVFLDSAEDLNTNTENQLSKLESTTKKRKSD